MSGDKSSLAVWKGARLLSAFALVFALGFASGYYYQEGSGSGQAVVINERGADCSDLFRMETAGPADPIVESEGTVTGPSPAGSVLSASDAVSANNREVSWQFAASKNSTLYHTRDCQFVKRIKEENLLTFSSSAEAEAAGKSPHGCVTD